MGIGNYNGGYLYSGLYTSGLNFFKINLFCLFLKAGSMFIISIRAIISPLLRKTARIDHQFQPKLQGQPEALSITFGLNLRMVCSVP